MEKIAELGISFRIVPVEGRDAVFVLKIEANVIGTDDVVSDRRHSWDFGFIRKTKSGTFLSFDRNSPRHRRMRVYSEFRSSAAVAAVRKVTERMSQIVAPKHLTELKSLDSAIELFEEIHRQIVVYTVMET